MFTRRRDIRQLVLENEQEDVDVVVPLSGISSAVGLDWIATTGEDNAGGYLYWTDVTNDQISRSRWDGSEQQVMMSWIS